MATKLGLLATELARTNPWWRSSTWADTDADLRPVTARSLGYRPTCLDGLTEGGLYLLRGPRRVGKTVAVKQTIDRLIRSGVPPRAVVRVAADGWSSSDLRTVVQNTALPASPDDQPRWWFLDEVTAVTGDWAAQVKWLRDNDPDFARATVVLTGSSAHQLTAATGVLAGRRGSARRTNRTLLPMGFATFARLLDPSLPILDPLPPSALRDRAAQRSYDELIPWIDVLVRLWERYLLYGGFPVAVAAARDQEPVPDYFVDDVFNVVFRDAFTASQLSITATSALVERVMSGMGSPLSMSAIAQSLDLSAETVRRHLSYLADAYLTWQCPQRQDGAWLARERAQDKVYAIDPLLARLAHLRNPGRADIDPTIITEMQLGMALHRAAEGHGLAWGEDEFVFHLRTPARKEIDFVSAQLGNIALEAKYTDGGRWVGEAATVDASRWDGVLATRSVLDTTRGDSAWAVPAAFLAYLVDT